jgi:hypothetical protein
VENGEKSAMKKYQRSKKESCDAGKYDTDIIRWLHLTGPGA